MAIQDRQLGLSGGVAIKAPVVVASTTNLTLSSSQVIDGILVGTTDDEGTRVLAKDQTDPKENGIYVSSATWVRAKDFNGTRDILPGSIVYVDRGTANGKTFWAFNSSSTDPTIEIGATKDDITVAQVTQALGVIPLTTEGDLLAYISGGATRLAIGTSGLVLVSTGGVPAWGTVGSTGLSDGAVIQGKLGSSAVQSTDLASSSVTGPKIAMGSDAQGDILVRGATAYERLAVGSSWKFLRAGATQPEWAAVPFDKLTATSESSVASIDITGLATSPYDTYCISVNNVIPGTDDSWLFFRVSNDNGVSFLSASSDYGYEMSYYNSVGGGASLTDNASNRIGLSGTASTQGLGNATGESGAGLIWIFDASSTSVYTHVFFQIAYMGADGSHYRNTGGGFVKTLGAYNACQILFGSSVTISADLALYGLEGV